MAHDVRDIDDSKERREPTLALRPADYRFSIGPGEDDAPPSLIVCEPLSDDPAAAACGSFALQLQPGTTLEQAHEIARTLQAHVKGFCRLEA